jgi:hypothetical protein
MEIIMSISKNALKIVLATSVVWGVSIANSQEKKISSEFVKNSQSTSSAMPSALPAIASPTLAEIAEAQRLKQLTDISKIKSDAAKQAEIVKAASSAAKQADAPVKKIAEKKLKPLPPTPPALTNKIHSTFFLRGVWKVEVSSGNGQNVNSYSKGEKIGNYTITDINASRVSFSSDTKGDLSLSLGGSF